MSSLQAFQPSKIHKKYPYAYLMERTLDINAYYLRGEHFSRVHKAGKNDIVLFGNVANLPFIVGEDQYGVAVKSAVLTSESQFIADLDIVQNGLVFQVGRACYIGIEKMYLPDQRFQKLTYLTVFGSDCQFIRFDLSQFVLAHGIPPHFVSSSSCCLS